MKIGNFPYRTPNVRKYLFNTKTLRVEHFEMKVTRERGNEEIKDMNV